MSVDNQGLFRPANIFSGFPLVVAGQSTRHGGVSPAPFHSLNLGLSTTDSAENVTENRRRFFGAMGFDPAQTASSHQVHGKEVLVTSQPGRYDGCDALITKEKDLLINVSVADCTPVLIFDPVQEVVAAVHAGWKGTSLGIVAGALHVMHKQYRTRSEDCLAFIGACIDACDYEVDNDVADHFHGEFKRWEASRGKFLLDLKSANRAQLISAGLQPGRIEVSPYSTVAHNTDYFSHRQEKGLTGRMLAVIGMKSISL